MDYILYVQLPDDYTGPEYNIIYVIKDNMITVKFLDFSVTVKRGHHFPVSFTQALFEHGFSKFAVYMLSKFLLTTLFTRRYAKTIDAVSGTIYEENCDDIENWSDPDE